MTTAETRVTSPSRPWTKLAPWAGIAFFVFFPVGVLFSGTSLDSDDSDAKWRNWFDDKGHRVGMIIGIYILIVAAILFIVFAAGLLERFRTSGGPSIPHRVAATTGTVFAGLTMIAAIQLGGVAGNISFGGTDVPRDADIMRQTLGYGTVLVAGGITAAAFIAATTALARAAGVFAQWLVVVSYIAAVLLLVAGLFLPMAALPIWVLIVSIVLLRKSAAAGAPGV